MFLNYLIFIFLFKNVISFNFEPKLSVVKQGPKNSYFGYSVAEHTIIDQNNRTSDALMLVGAPLAMNQDSKSGSVYKCKLSSNKNDCDVIRIDTDDKTQSNAIKENQWLGVTVKSQGPGGFVLACAHRYVLSGPDYQWGQGICYSLTQQLMFHRVWEPCYNRPTNKAHEQYGYCQAGTSGDVSSDHEIIIGTPGPFTWRGTIFTNSITYQIRDDKQWYSVPLENNSPVDKYSYLGMSVVSSKMINNRMTYITGAPRSNGTGQVFLFTKRSSIDRRNFYSRLNDNNSSLSLVKELVIDGEQFASSFGYTLATLDINGDKNIDLVIGAPFYYNAKSGHAGGAVYIYLNKDGKGPTNKYDQQLLGNSESRFGFALANLDDINKDGYQDLAVGAPYDSDGGAIYIYLGSESGLNLNPVQIIRAADVLTDIPNLKTFGYSLSGGIDLDENGYPDLLVGAYESDSVVLLRTRPIIDIETSVEGKLDNIDPTIAGCEEDRNSKLTCFSISVCFKIKTPLRNSNQLQLEYKIEAETFENYRKYYRVKFNSSQDTDTPNIVKKIVQISTIESEREKCSKELIYLKVNKDKSDIQNPIKFQLTFKLLTGGYKVLKQNDRLPDINKYPVLNKIEAQKIFEAKFHKDCGPDDICESDLRLNSVLSLKNDDKVYLLELEEKQFSVTITVSNRGEPAYDAKVFIEHHYGLNYVKMNIIRGDSVDCLPKKTYLECSLGNPYTRGESQFVLYFSPNSALDDESKIYFKMHANTTSNDLFDAKNIQNFEVDVIRRAELEIIGVENPSQALYGAVTTTNIENVEDIGSLSVHKYFVANYGPWKAKSVNIDIQWPYEMYSSYHKDSGKGLLYLVSVNVTNGGYCTFPNKYSPNNFNLKNTRFRREAIITSKEVKEDGKTLNIVQMDCKIKTAKCYIFTCHIPLLNIHSNAIITIVGRLWNATLVENYAHGVNQVHILSRAKVYLDKNSNIKPFEENGIKTEAVAKTRAYPDSSSLPAQRPSIWIIILAIIFGILILIALILALWKCGFFKRKKPGYIEASQEDDY